MKIKTFPFFFTLIACVFFVMCGHKDNKKYCPAYPREKTDYIPVNAQGEKLQYLVGNDTIELVVGSPIFSPRYDEVFTEALEDRCWSFMRLQLNGMDSSDRIHYTITASGDDNHSLDVMLLQISLLHKNATIVTFNDILKIEPVHRWISPSGMVFEDVSILSTEKDTLYLSKSKGLLRYAPNPEVSNYEEWLLLPEN